MKNNHFAVLILLFLVTCYSCTPESTDKPVTDAADYEPYLTDAGVKAQLEKIDEEIKFWSDRLECNPAAFVPVAKIAGQLNRRFFYSGKIEDLLTADSLYQEVNKVQQHFTSSVYRSLAQISITRHRFRQAKAYVDSALTLGDNRHLSNLVAFDAALELGEDKLAGLILEDLPDKNSFDYLIRAAKLADGEGDLDLAIHLMEQASAKADSLGIEPLIGWSKTNLGDMYGHANRFHEAYRCYLDALALDPAAFHALKGIAWLAYSHDHDLESSKRILRFLAQNHSVPDYDLLLEEIAAFENDVQGRKKHLAAFLEKAQSPCYGDMYNTYLFNLFADETSQADAALCLAEQEVANRPKPESFHLLAWAFYQKGDTEKSLEIMHREVENKCFEPGVLLRLGKIYASNGQALKAEKYFREVRASGFELGPLAVAELKRALN